MDTGYEIDEIELTRFVAEQLRVIAATPLPAELAATLPRDDCDIELSAIWLGAGLATQVGLPLLEHPELFVRPRAAPPAPG